MQSFSQRQGFVRPKEIQFREDLPEHLRIPIYEILRRNVSASFLLERAENLFNPYGIDTLPVNTGSIAMAKEEDDRNTIAFKRLLLGCAWFQIYDLIEDTFSQLLFHEQELAEPDEEARAFPMQQAINDYFLHAGIGWRIVDGRIIVRSSEAFEAVVTTAAAVLKESERPTAAKHLHEALQDLSRRPEADLAGAIYHAMGSMECVARDLTGAPKATLGEILKQYPALLPKPLDSALSQVWGYASKGSSQTIPDIPR